MAAIELALVEGNFGFESKDDSGQVIKMDASPDFGGHNYGTRPMIMLLHALAGCSSIDGLSILRKQKQQINSFKVLVDGDREAKGDVSLWKNIEIVFQLSGDISPEKAEKAFRLSVEKYCSVATTLELAGATVTHRVEIV